MIRMEPFTTLHIQLQSGRLGTPATTALYFRKKKSPAILQSHVGTCLHCLGLTAQTDSSTLWQRPGRLALRAQLTSKSSSRSSSTTQKSCRTWTVRKQINLLRFVACWYKYLKGSNASLLRYCCRLRPGTFADISRPGGRCSAASLGLIKRRLHQATQESPGESTQTVYRVLKLF